MGAGRRAAPSRDGRAGAGARRRAPEEEPVSVAATRRGRQQVIGYVEIEAGEGVARLEKVASERIGSERYDVWDVETESGRWWAIGGDTLGAYDQADYTSSDVALSFHVGISARLQSEIAGARTPGGTSSVRSTRSPTRTRPTRPGSSVPRSSRPSPRSSPPATARSRRMSPSTAVELARAAAWLAAAEDARPDECRILLDGVRQLLESAARLR